MFLIALDKNFVSLSFTADMASFADAISPTRVRRIRGGFACRWFYQRPIHQQGGGRTAAKLALAKAVALSTLQKQFFRLHQPAPKGLARATARRRKCAA